MEKSNKKGKSKIIIIFAILIILILIAIAIAIILSPKSNVNQESINQEQDSKEEQDNSDMEADVNQDALPSSNPSISGTSNVEKIDDKKTNISEKIKEEKIVGVYTFYNIKIVQEENKSIITANISNTVKEKKDGVDAIIKFYDDAGNLVSQMDTYIPQVKPNEITFFRTETSADIVNAYDLEIILK